MKIGSKEWDENSGGGVWGVGGGEFGAGGGGDGAWG